MFIVAKCGRARAMNGACPPAISLRQFQIAAFSIVIFGLSVAVAAAEPVKTRFNIDAKPASQSLTDYARQARVQLGFAEDVVDDILTNPVVGEYDNAQALELLLKDTGLEAEHGDRGIFIRRTPTEQVSSGIEKPPRAIAKTNSLQVMRATVQAASQTSTTSATSNSRVGDKQKPIQVEEIVVTGTSIRGIIPESSPLEVYDAIDIRNTGALTTEQFISALPQNNSTLSEVGGGSSTRENNSASTSSVDLRGLGVGTTLVLLNGRRMAPSSSGRTADLSFIPIGVVERVEVLTDGASAIYGADAIGGVVNFVLREQQDSAETVLTGGGADGGSEYVRIDQSFGFNWTDGNALIALSHTDRNALDASDRNFSRAAGAFTLIPEDIRTNVFATVSHLVPGNVTISTDLLHSAKEPFTAQTLTQFGGDDFRVRDRKHEQTVLNLAIERSFGEKVNAALLATYADTSADTNGFSDGPSIGLGSFFESEDTSTLDVTVKVDGELARFRNGALMFALGAGYTTEEFEEVRDFSKTSGFTSEIALDRETKYAFAELLVPIASSEQNISGVRRLELSLSARYTNYSDFGDDTSPKVGVLWAPTERLKFRGTFGESFKAPFLPQLNPVGGFYFLFPTSVFTFVNDIWSTDNSSTVLFSTTGTTPGLGAEEAETYTFGFDVELSGLAVSATYFNIDYTDRIAQPDPGSTASLISPQGFSDIYNLNPTLEQITEVLAGGTGVNLTGLDIDDPAAVLAGITVYGDNRTQNLSISEVDGFDLRVDYTTEIPAGVLNFGVNATKMISFDDRIFASAAPITRIDTVLFPADLKARGYVGFGKDRWNARLNVNYVDQYDNPFSATNPTIDDWSTVDLLFSYEFPSHDDDLSDGVRLGLTVKNAFDEDPPFLPVGTSSDFSIINAVGFDPANANPLGRFISVQVSKSW